MEGMERLGSTDRMSNTDDQIEQRRARARELAAQFAERGDNLGWFDEFYREAAGDNEQIPWADLEPNRFFSQWAEQTGLTGNGRKALVVGCGLGDDARYLHDLGFSVTAFDISPTAIEWAKRISEGRDIRFEVADLFYPYRGWLGAFDFVLEIYTIQPLPLEMRERTIDAIAAFVADGGDLVVVTRGRENDEEPVQLPWPLSRRDLSRFATNGLTETDFIETIDAEDEQKRFIITYRRR
jgi:SAM-dependent methyltransferase